MIGPRFIRSQPVSRAEAEQRGRAAGEVDESRCELAPSDCVNHYDAWLAAYRAAWARRAVAPTILVHRLDQAGNIVHSRRQEVRS